MTPEEKKRKFEEDLVEIAIAEYYAYVAEKNKRNPSSMIRTEKDAKMFYDAMRLGVIRGINFATNQYIQSLKNFEEKKNESTNGIKETNQASESISKTNQGE